MSWLKISIKSIQKLLFRDLFLCEKKLSFKNMQQATGSDCTIFVTETGDHNPKRTVL